MYIEVTNKMSGAKQLVNLRRVDVIIDAKDGAEVWIEEACLRVSQTYEQLFAAVQALNGQAITRLFS